MKFRNLSCSYTSIFDILVQDLKNIAENCVFDQKKMYILMRKFERFAINYHSHFIYIRDRTISKQYSIFKIKLSRTEDFLKFADLV